MHKYLPITDVYAREILDSRGNPTIEVEVLAGGEFLGRASVPSGASTGQYEALELRDKAERYGGLGVELAADHVNARIAPAIIGVNVFDQPMIDRIMCKLDGTEISQTWGRTPCWECLWPQPGQRPSPLGFPSIPILEELMGNVFRCR